MNEPTQYAELIKPFWSPPSWLFGPVWTVLYAIIAVSFGTVFYKAVSGKLAWMVALPFALNLLFNFAFIPLQFGLKINLLAAIDILLVVGTPHPNSTGWSTPTSRICCGRHLPLVFNSPSPISIANENGVRS
jgi:hypothetical protein